MDNKSKFVDVKTPEGSKNIVSLANKASNQGGEACISDFSYKFNQRFADVQAERILNNKSNGEYTYKMEQVHFVIRGKVHSYKNQRKN